MLLSADKGMPTAAPRYIFEAMWEAYSDKFDYMWLLNNPSRMPECFRSVVRTVSFLSPAHTYHMLTSRFLISNLGVEPFMPMHKGQRVISTHHSGGAYKSSRARITTHHEALGPLKKGLHRTKWRI